VNFEAEMVSIPRAELDALMAELGRLRRELVRDRTEAGIQAAPGPAGGAQVLAREALARAWGVTE
jgi:hypothetical protein